ncbi:MAG: type VI secretion system tube protein Hcp [Deltaproteobacteria bacterium]|nr:type VI secretion system tube protein Hcp [Deltaproteobacteria bacterium]
MALNAYLSLAGDAQGPIQGSVTQKGREGKILIIAVEHERSSPYDAASGMIAGRTKSGPLVLTKEIDKSSPLLRQAFKNREQLGTFELQFWRPTATGAETQFYTIRLKGASIVSFRTEMLNNQFSDNVPLKEREVISFAYQQLELTWVSGGISHTHDWAAASA